MPFDRKRLILNPIRERVNDLDSSAILPLRPVHNIHPSMLAVAQHIQTAKSSGRPVILMTGAHLIRSGVQRYIIDLMEKGYLSCVALNGAGMIHDFEFAMVGATTESVATYIRKGQFGLWKETGLLNDIIRQAAPKNLGMGEAVGQYIVENNFSYRDISLLAAGYRFKLPVTIHVGIGYDIIHEHPNCDGAATGATSYRDFLRFTNVIENLEGGVVMNFGSAVMGPEVYLKALSMARNVARQEHREIKHFTTLVCDLHALPDDVSQEPSRENPAYYFRPWKTMLIRTVADGGKSFYIQGRHAETVPSLWSALQKI